MKQQKGSPEPENRVVKIALIIFTLMSLATVSCEKAKGLCEKTEEVVYALRHLMGAFNSPPDNSSTHSMPPTVNSGGSMPVMRKEEQFANGAKKAQLGE